MNSNPFKHKSFCWVTWAAREMAAEGKSAQEIADKLDLHIVAAYRVVDDYAKHTKKLGELLAK